MKFIILNFIPASTIDIMNYVTKVERLHNVPSTIFKFFRASVCRINPSNLNPTQNSLFSSFLLNDYKTFASCVNFTFIVLFNINCNTESNLWSLSLFLYVNYNPTVCTCTYTLVHMKQQWSFANKCRSNQANEPVKIWMSKQCTIKGILLN